MMSHPSEPQPVISSPEEIMASGSYLYIGSDSLLDDYAFYLEYRAQRDLYDFCRRVGRLSWSDFVLAMRHCGQVRDAAGIVVREAVRRFVNTGCFNFDAEDRPLYTVEDLADAEDADCLVTCCKLYEPAVGRGFVLEILLKAEIAQYRRQLDRGKTCSWEEFLLDVTKNPDLWAEIMRAFCDALTTAISRLLRTLLQARTSSVPAQSWSSPRRSSTAAA